MSKDIFHGYFQFVVIANLYENVIPILGRFHKLRVIKIILYERR